MHHTLPDRQPHLDLILLLQRNIALSQLHVKYIHVYGHLDEGKHFSQLSLPQQLNVMADKLAKECLLTNISDDSMWGSTYPHEPVRIWVDGIKVTSSIRSALYRSWGSHVARKLFQRRCIVNRYSFHHIAWDYVGHAMAAYPQMFSLWVTKHVSGFNGTNRQLSRFQAEVTNKCPCCGHKDESSAHITRCSNAGRRRIFEKSIDSLLDWMENTHSDIQLVECLESYLLAQGEGSMVTIAAPFPHLASWAMELDTLGWDNLLEGKIGGEFLALQQRTMQLCGSRRHIKSWATEFIHQLLGITHKQ